MRRRRGFLGTVAASVGAVTGCLGSLRIGPSDDYLFNRTVDPSGPDVPQFQADAGHTGRTGSTGIDSEPSIYWRRRRGGEPQPVVVDEWVFVGGTHALSRSRGEVEWSRDVGRGTVPAYHDGTLYVTTAVVTDESADEYGLLALDAATGETEWRRLESTPVRVDPAVTDRGVYVVAGTDDRSLTGFDHDGRRIFSREITDRPFTPAVADRTLVQAATNSRIVAIDTETGAENWRYGVGGDFRSAPTVSDGSVYFLDTDATLHALDLRTGAERWTSEVAGGATDGAHPAGLSVPADGPIVVSMRARGGHVVVGYDRQGRQLWQRRFQSTEIKGAPVTAGDTAFVPSGGTVQALALETGRQKWEYSFRSDDRGDTVAVGNASTPVVTGGILTAGTSLGDVVSLGVDP